MGDHLGPSTSSLGLSSNLIISSTIISSWLSESWLEFPFLSTVLLFISLVVPIVCVSVISVVPVYFGRSIKCSPSVISVVVSICIRLGINSDTCCDAMNCDFGCFSCSVPEKL
uniref:Uncharacterized protein n=1 Tax=Cacopsylla melanoneura TaxID=428564 RepID=A0A8D8QRR5_9HEMI